VLLCVARANKSTELNNFTIAFPEGWGVAEFITDLITQFFLLLG
jgi:hypothetical protein